MVENIKQEVFCGAGVLPGMSVLRMNQKILVLLLFAYIFDRVVGWLANVCCVL